MLYQVMPKYRIHSGLFIWDTDRQVAIIIIWKLRSWF